MHSGATIFHGVLVLKPPSAQDQSCDVCTHLGHHMDVVHHLPAAAAEIPQVLQVAPRIKPAASMKHVPTAAAAAQHPTPAAGPKDTEHASL